MVLYLPVLRLYSAMRHLFFLFNGYWLHRTIFMLVDMGTYIYLYRLPCSFIYVNRYDKYVSSFYYFFLLRLIFKNLDFSCKKKSV